MARNGSGTYSLPNDDLVNGETSSATDYNSTMDDIATALTNSLAKDGQTVLTGNLDFNGNAVILDADGDTSINADIDDQIDIEIGGSDDYILKAASFDFNGNELILNADGDTSITADTDDQIDIKIGGSDAHVLTADGFTTFGGQIAFPATQNASSGANTLDDYEEGTWTPVLTDGSSPDATYTTQNGVYTKIGDMVYIELHIVTTAIGTLSGNVSVTGLPFTCNATIPGGVVCNNASGLAISAGTSITGDIGVSGSSINMRLWDATTGPTVLQFSEWSADGAAVFHGQYRV